MRPAARRRMTAPRQVLPGVTYHLTRRCTQRTFLLRPSDCTNDVFLYVLAVAAQRFGVRVHGFCVLSNHCHLVVTDPDARLPEFTQFLHAFVARALNASLGHKEAFWNSKGCSVVTLVAPEDVVDKTAYTLANPVAAGLVRTARMWPGLWSEPERFGTSIEVKRPRHFFAEDGDMPQTATLELTIPPGFESVEQFRAAVLSGLKSREEEAQQRFGRNFLGVARVLNQNPTGRPTSFEPRSTLNPRVAARDTAQRVAALRRLKEFVNAYREAWAAWRSGARDVVFPTGTYMLRVWHGVPCAEFG